MDLSYDSGFVFVFVLVFYLFNEMFKYFRNYLLRWRPSYETFAAICIDPVDFLQLSVCIDPIYFRGLSPKIDFDR